MQVLRYPCPAYFVAVYLASMVTIGNRSKRIAIVQGKAFLALKLNEPGFTRNSKKPLAVNRPSGRAFIMQYYAIFSFPQDCKAPITLSTHSYLFLTTCINCAFL